MVNPSQSSLGIHNHLYAEKLLTNSIWNIVASRQCSPYLEGGHWLGKEQTK